MHRAALSTSDNLFDFFLQQVDVAVHASDTEVSEEGVFYLASLLVERGRMRDEETEETLAELHISARNSPPGEAIRAWRELGDSALYVTGFFRGSLRRKPVGLDYYLEMGSGAYHRLASILRTPTRLVGGPIGGHKAMDAIFEELSVAFGACSEVLQEVRSNIRAEADADTSTAILELYEAWLETGSPQVARRLRALGVVLDDILEGDDHLV